MSRAFLQIWFEYKYGYEDKWSIDPRHLIPHSNPQERFKHYKFWPLDINIPYFASDLKGIASIEIKDVKKLLSVGWYRSSMCEYNYRYNYEYDYGFRCPLWVIGPTMYDSKVSINTDDYKIYFNSSAYSGSESFMRTSYQDDRQVHSDRSIQFEYPIMDSDGTELMEFCFILTPLQGKNKDQSQEQSSNFIQDPLYNLFANTIGGRSYLKKYVSPITREVSDYNSIKYSTKIPFNELYKINKSKHVTPMEYVRYLQSTQNNLPGCDNAVRLKSVIYDELNLYIGGAAKVLHGIVLDYANIIFLVRCFVQSF